MFAYRLIPVLVLPALILTAALPAAAFAYDAEEEVVSSTRVKLPTAEDVAQIEASRPATPVRPLTTDEQIAYWLATSPARERTGDSAALWPDAGTQRRVHGEAGVSVGTGGYSSAYVSTVIPIGDNGYLGLTYSQTDFGENGGYGFGYRPYDHDRAYDGYRPYSDYAGPGRAWNNRGGRQQSFGVSLDFSDDTRPADACPRLSRGFGTSSGCE